MTENNQTGTDSFYLEGEDPEAVQEAMELKKREIRDAGGSILNEHFETKLAGDQEVAEARFDYRMALDQLAAEVEFDPPDVEDPQGDTTIEQVRD